MKTLLIGWLLSTATLPVLAQISSLAVPDQLVTGDSLGRPVSPAVQPIGTEFYRRPGDPRNVVRATLDNMPIHTPSPLQEYTMLNSHLNQPYHPNELYRYRIPVPDSLRLKFRRSR